MEEAFRILHCPRCRTAYRLPRRLWEEEDAIFVCARCKQRFTREGPLDDAAEAPAASAPPPQTRAQEQPSLFERKKRPATSQTPPKADALAVESPPIPAANAPLRRWLGLLAFAFFSVAAAGFAHHAERWQAQPKVHQALLWLGLAKPSALDWEIPSDRVEAQRIQRSDGSTVLVIAGEVRNASPVPLAPPKLRLQLLDEAGLLEERRMPITEPPSLDAIVQEPWHAPRVDRTPVPPGSRRAFVLVVPHPPEDAARFALGVLP